MSLRINLEENAYNAGFSHPRLDFPAAFRAAFTSDTIPANTGADAEVPDKLC